MIKQLKKRNKYLEEQLLQITRPHPPVPESFKEEPLKSMRYNFGESMSKFIKYDDQSLNNVYID